MATHVKSPFALILVIAHSSFVLGRHRSSSVGPFLVPRGSQFPLTIAP
jgi:hypothetical protein